MMGSLFGIDMPVDKELERIVAMTFAHTERLLEQSEASWDVARQSVEKIMSDLTERWPRHADWIRSRLAEWSRTHAN